MLVKVEAGQTFIAPSNSYGDYVLALDAQGTDTSVPRSVDGGALTNAMNPLRWYPGFRVTNYNYAQRLNLGSKLKSDIVGPLNYRVGYSTRKSKALTVKWLINNNDAKLF